MAENFSTKHIIYIYTRIYVEEILGYMLVSLLYVTFMRLHHTFLQTQQDNALIPNPVVKPYTGPKCAVVSLNFVVNVRLDLFLLKPQKVCQGWQHWRPRHLRCLLYPHLYTTASLFQFLCTLGDNKFRYSPWQ